MNLAPRTTRSIGRQRLAVVLVHRVEVLVNRQRGIHHHAAIRIVRTQQHGRFVRASQRIQTILHARQHDLRKPLHIILIGRHRLAQTAQQTHVGILLHEGGNALARIVGHKRCDGTVAVLRAHPVMLGKGFRKQDVVEHLNHEDTALRGLVREEREHLLVLAEGLLVHLHGEGVILELHERGKGVPVPQIDRIHAVLYEHIEVLHPQLLVVEPGEILGRIGVLIDRATGQVVGLLHTDTRTAQDHLGGILEMVGGIEFSLGLHAVNQFAATIQQTAPVVTRNGNRLTIVLDTEALLFQPLGIQLQADGPVGLLRNLIAVGLQSLREVCCRKERLLGRFLGKRQLHNRLGAGGEHQHDTRQKECLKVFHHLVLVLLV